MLAVWCCFGGGDCDFVVGGLLFCDVCTTCLKVVSVRRLERKDNTMKGERKCRKSESERENQCPSVEVSEGTYGMEVSQREVKTSLVAEIASKNNRDFDWGTIETMKIVPPTPPSIPLVVTVAWRGELSLLLAVPVAGRRECVSVRY